MKDKTLRFALLLTLSTFSAFADTFVWGDTYAQAWQGFGTSPYSAHGSGANANITIFCLDFNDQIAPPFTWNATVWNLTQANVQNEAQYGGNYNNLLDAAYQTSNPGQNAPNQVSGPPYAFVTDDAGGSYKADLTNSPDAYTRYLEAAWLFSEIEAAGSQTPFDLVFQAAAWDLFVNTANQADLAQDIQNTNADGNIYGFQDYIDPAGSATANVSGIDFQQAVDYALNAAQAAVVTNHTFTGDGWTIVTADPTWVETDGKTIPAQEFLSPNAVDPPPVPEPSSIVLLATLAGAAWFGRNRRMMSRISGISAQRQP